MYIIVIYVIICYTIVAVCKSDVKKITSYLKIKQVRTKSNADRQPEIYINEYYTYLISFWMDD